MLGTPLDEAMWVGIAAQDQIIVDPKGHAAGALVKKEVIVLNGNADAPTIRRVSKLLVVIAHQQLCFMIRMLFSEDSCDLAEKVICILIESNVH